MDKEIKKVMIDKNISHKQMAEFLGISYQSWYRKLHKKEDFKLEEVKKINEVLEVNILTLPT